MHYIEKCIDGTYTVGIFGQSGHERETHEDLSSAIRGYRNGMHLLGGLKGDISDIAIPPILDKGSWPVVVAEPPHGFDIEASRVRDAIELALSRQQLEIGRRYEFRVVLVRVAEDPGFVGSGI